MSIRLHRFYLFAATLVLVATPLAGCQKAQQMMTDSAIEHATAGKVKISRDGDRVVIKGEDGELAMQHGDALPLPKDFPADIYLPKGYRINSVMDLGGTQVISLQAPGKVADMFGSARDAMDKQGWKQTMAMQNSTDTAMLTYEKAERAAVMSFNSDRGEQGVSMSLQVRGKQM